MDLINRISGWFVTEDLSGRGTDEDYQAGKFSSPVFKLPDGSGRPFTQEEVNQLYNEKHKLRTPNLVLTFPVFSDSVGDFSEDDVTETLEYPTGPEVTIAQILGAVHSRMSGIATAQELRDIKADLERKLDEQPELEVAIERIDSLLDEIGGTAIAGSSEAGETGGNKTWTEVWYDETPFFGGVVPQADGSLLVRLER